MATPGGLERGLQEQGLGKENWWFEGANLGQLVSAALLGCGEWENEQLPLKGTSGQADWGAQERGQAEVMLNICLILRIMSLHVSFSAK